MDILKDCLCWQRRTPENASVTTRCWQYSPIYLQARYGWDSALTGQVFGGFLAAVYFLPVLGGFLADKYLGYGKTITIGTVIMFLGYALLAFPFGNGLISMSSL